MLFFLLSNSRLKSGLLYLLPESLGIIPECLIFPIPGKSTLRPTSGHWIWTFDSSLESHEQKEVDYTNFA